MKLERSIAAFARARRAIAAGVNSPVRALGAVGLSPVFMKGLINLNKRRTSANLRTYPHGYQASA